MTRTFKVVIAVGSLLFLAFFIAGSTRASDEPQIIHVTLQDDQVKLSQFVVTPGRVVKFVITNQGALSHQFVVQPFASAGASKVEDAPVIAAGTTWTIQYTLSPGIYRVACSLRDHAEKGMVNVLAADVARPLTIPMNMEFVLPILALVLGSAYIIGDSLGLRLTRVEG
ncbi:MAG: cupredoxin domain-containing protein [Chloroflexi bacterium]|nr:cupredoxin domain-containing protein [Chloroflexota bacterium]